MVRLCEHSQDEQYFAATDCSHSRHFTFRGQTSGRGYGRDVDVTPFDLLPLDKVDAACALGTLVEVAKEQDCFVDAGSENAPD